MVEKDVLYYIMPLQTLERKVHLCFRLCVKAAYVVWHLMVQLMAEGVYIEQLRSC